MPGLNTRLWKTKPPPGTRLARGFDSPDLLCLPFNETASGIWQNMVNRGMGGTSPGSRATVAAGTVTIVGGPFGPMASLTTIGSWISCGFNEYVTATPPISGTYGGNSILFGMNKRDTTVRANSAMFGLSSGTNARRFDGLINTTAAQFDFGGQDATHRLASAGGLTYGGYEIWCMNQGPRGQEIWRGGSLIASNASTAITRDTGTETDTLLLGTGGGNSASDLVDFDFVYIWSHQIAEALIQDLTANPWKIFEAHKTRLFAFSTPAVVIPHAPPVMAPILAQ